MATMTTLLAMLVLGIIVKSHAYSGTGSGNFKWNSNPEKELTEEDSEEFEEINDPDDDDPEFDEGSKRAKVKIDKTGLVIDFEKDNHDDYLITAKNSLQHSVVTNVHKNGEKSFLWTWATKGELPKLILKLKKKRSEEELKSGGIKFWMYRESKTPHSKMQIIFHGSNKKGSSAESSPTDVELNFQGWRAVWISYGEFYGNDFPLKTLKKIKFKIISPKSKDKLYIDLVQFTRGLSTQSRDLVVSQVGQTGPKKNDPISHDDKDFWQQTLRWHNSPYSRSTDELTNVDTKIQEINEIENRLENWYAKVGEALNSLGDDKSKSSEGTESSFDVKAMKNERWNSLLPAIQKAHEIYGNIEFENNRPPLFTKVSDYGKEKITKDPGCMTKFGYVFSKVLLPLSLEYSLLSRKAEVEYLGNNICKDFLTSDNIKYQNAIKTVAGENMDMMKTFDGIVKKGSGGIKCVEDQPNEDVEKMINQFNDVRFDRIIKLLKFVGNQGFAFGSALGSFDHEMNKVGAGFMHSMFLLRNSLRKYKDISFDDLLKTMKWYCDFKEIYQPENYYVYDGTTTDRMRTILLYRLMIILMEPANTKEEKENKIRDMIHFKTWFKHALKINKGLGGVIKPDFTGFHHKTFYGAAYVPESYHNAALVQYFLEGTTFELDQESKNNLRMAVGVMRMVSVKYSTPNSICGRFPSYTKATLATQFPTYAYISYAHPKNGESQPLDRPEMFLRLFDTNNPSVLAYLKNGAPRSHIYYWNTIGSLDIFEKMVTTKCESNKVCKAESSPSGHWSKNFASLSIHRRDDWSVVARGFGKYTWDFESSGGKKNENLYGIFLSHGSLQISNNEDALKSYDVSNGWDWTRIPGTTTIRVDLTDLDKILAKARNYNYNGFAGGVSFIGTSENTKPKQGAFGMLFKTPAYSKTAKNSPLRNLKEFRKSYFFYDDLIICLGSDIKFVKPQTNTDGIYAQTTLFQDKMLKGSRKIKINGKTRRLNRNYAQKWSTQTQPVKLQDTHGNIYQIKLVGDNQLHVKISVQSSKTHKGKPSSAKYATAWLEHTKSTSTSARDSTRYMNKFNNSLNSNTGETVNTSESENVEESQDILEEEQEDTNLDLDEMATGPTGTTEAFKYEYSIIIKGGDENMLSKYRVVQQDTDVHAIELITHKVYGYSFFSSIKNTPMTSGPVRSVDAPCIIMAEKKSKILKLAITNHDFSFEYNPEYKNKITCTRRLRKVFKNVFHPESSYNVGVKLMFCVEGKGREITVTLESDADQVNKVIVDGEEKKKVNYAKFVTVNAKEVKFKNLVNGFTTEVELKLK